MTPADMVRDKRVAIIGRAESIHHHGNGALIDVHDIIVRINWTLPLEGEPARIGSRTDILLHAYSARELPKNAATNGVTAWRKDDELGRELARAFGVPKVVPRTGVTAVAMIARAGARSIYLAGYDFYATGNATRSLPDAALRRVAGRNKTGGHDTEADRVILRALVREHACQVDDVLRAALGDA